MLTRLYLLVLALGLGVAFTACSNDDDPGAPNNNGTDTTDTTGTTPPSLGTATNATKAGAEFIYDNLYTPSALTTAELNWTGNTSSCTPGTVAQSAHDAVEMRINYFRKMVGLPFIPPLDAALNTQCQQAALMMDAENALSHSPDPSWACYTPAGAEAAEKSNLYLGRVGVAAVDGFIEDPGAGNEVVGHRRWLLYTRSGTFGHGSTTQGNAIWVIGNFVTQPDSLLPEFIAWPPKGFVPNALAFPRWSFGLPGNADFGSANVTMTGPGNTAVPVTIVHREAVGGSFTGDNTIVWEPAGINTASVTDQTYTVTVSGISGAPQSSYTYTVTLYAPAGKRLQPAPTDPGQLGPAPVLF